MKRFEKIPATAGDPLQSGKLPFAIPIADSRENSIKDAESATCATEDIKLYADSPVINRKVGAAAVLMRTGNPPRILHLHLGPESELTIHEADQQAFSLACISSARRSMEALRDRCGQPSGDQGVPLAFKKSGTPLREGGNTHCKPGAEKE